MKAWHSLSEIVIGELNHGVPDPDVTVLMTQAQYKIPRLHGATSFKPRTKQRHK